MLLDDFTLLGKTAPEVQKDGRSFVCSAGISDTCGLVRIYPLAVEGTPGRWSRNEISLTRNPKDVRPESYQINGDRDPDNHPAINRMFRKVGKTKPTEIAEIVARNTVPSISFLNERRRSLGFLRVPAGSSEIEWKENELHPDHPQVTLDLSVPGESAGPLVRGNPFTPVLRFESEDGTHRLQIRDWGAYEYLRKQFDRDGLYKALHLDSDRLLFVGNMNSRKNAWLVISVLPPIGHAGGFAPDQMSLAAA